MAWGRSQNVPVDQPSCLWLSVCPPLGPSDQAFRNSVVIVRVWPQCWEMNEGLLGSHAGNKVMCVPLLNFRVYVTCKTQIDWFVYAGRREQGCLSSDWRNSVISLGFLYLCSLSLTHTQIHSLIPGRHRSWPETRPIWTQFSPTDSQNNQKQQPKMHADVCR